VLRRRARLRGKVESALRSHLATIDRSASIAPMNRFVAILILAVVSAMAYAAPLGTAFTYQGQLTEAGQPANGLYDLQACVFDAADSPVALACVADIEDVPVEAGVFSVALDFGSDVFGGDERWLQLGVRPGASVGTYTALAPRQTVRATPYALEASNARQFGGVAADGYIRNSPQLQSGAEFNIGGNAAAGSLDLRNALTVAGTPTAPDLAPPGQGRMYFDSVLDKFRVSEAGTPWTDLVGGASGGGVGGSGSIGSVPLWSGGTTLGDSLVSQSGNGVLLPNSVTLAANAGNQVAFGSPNAETGMTIAGSAGRADIRFDGSALKLVAGPPGSPPASTRGIVVSTSGDVGINTTDTTNAKLTVVSSGNVSAIYGETFANGVSVLGVTDGGTAVAGFSTTAAGRAGYFEGNVLIFGTLQVSLDSGGNQPVCRQNASGALAACSSSQRYKTDVQPFTGGMELVARLEPHTYRWKSDGSSDVGFIAEEVAAVEPLLVTHNAKGEIEGVKYDRLGAAFVNALKQQQAQIEQLQQSLDALRQRDLEAENAALKSEVGTLQAQVAAILARLPPATTTASSTAAP
jgi:hypothetical protein